MHQEDPEAASLVNAPSVNPRVKPSTICKNGSKMNTLKSFLNHSNLKEKTYILECCFCTDIAQYQQN